MNLQHCGGDRRRNLQRCGGGCQADLTAACLQSQVAYDYFRDRFSVEANDPVQQDEQVLRQCCPDDTNTELFQCT